MRGCACLLLLAAVAAAQEPVPVAAAADGKSAVRLPGASEPVVVDAALAEGFALGDGGAAVFLDRAGTHLLRLSFTDAAPAVVWRAALAGPCAGWWLDAERGKVVAVVAEPARAFEVALDGGGIAPAPLDVIWSAVGRRGTCARALEAAAEAMPPDAARRVAGIAEDPGAPVAWRLRAALIRRRAGGAPAPVALLDAATAREETAADKVYAVRHAPVLLGEDAAGWLERAGRRADLALAAVDALASLGEAGVRPLVYLLSHPGVPAAARRAASRRLARLPGDAVAEAAVRELEETDAETGGLVLSTLIAAGVDDLPARVQPHERTLLEVLEKRTADVGWLADYFRDRPTTQAVNGLLGALAAHRRDRALAARLVAALKSCTGYDLGHDPDVWLRELGKR